MDLEMNMSRACPGRSRRIATWLYGPDPINSVAIRPYVDAANEVGVQWRRIVVAGMRIPPEAIGLPDGEPQATERLSLAIENTPGDFDYFSLRESGPSLDCGQVVAFDRLSADRKERPQNLVRRPMSIRAVPRHLRPGPVSRWTHDRCQSSGEKPDARTMGPQRSKSDLTSPANSAGVTSRAWTETLARLALKVSVPITARIAPLRRSTVAAGVFAATKTPNHSSACKAEYPASCTV